jgi:hypothetical protein
MAGLIGAVLLSEKIECGKRGANVLMAMAMD